MPARFLRINGLVQGVFFRAIAKDKADELGVKGWVRNSSDGSVEAHAEGTDVQLSAFEEWCHRGPARALVEKVIVKDVSEEGCTAFEIR